jgi:hypothetical protein
MVELLDQGQLLMDFNNPNTQTAIKEIRWDGAVHPGGSNYLYLVDSNVGFTRVDSVIQRSLAYQVDLIELSHPTGEVTLTYQPTGSGDVACKQEINYGNGNYQDMQQRCFLDYWRVYVPGGSELLASTAQAVSVDVLLNGLDWSGQIESLPCEAGRQVFAGLLMLPPSRSANIFISYYLPLSIVQPEDTNLYEYVLRVQVQPGLEGLPFKLEIKFPNNTSRLNPSQRWRPVDTHSWVWQGLLDKTVELSLQIQADPYP